LVTAPVISLIAFIQLFLPVTEPILVFSVFGPVILQKIKVILLYHLILSSEDDHVVMNCMGCKYYGENV